MARATSELPDPSCEEAKPKNSIADFVSQEAQYKGKTLPNAMSVDVEDYFQVSAFEGIVSRDDWPNIPARLPANTERILQLFADADANATFFVLGWVCRRFPDVVRAIADAGHEIASHGSDHSRVGALSQKQYLADVRDTRNLLEDTAGCKVIGYRAPSFSIGFDTLWAHDVLVEAGYEYSSSVFPVQHDHYGLPQAPRFPFRCSSGDLLEIPMSSVRLFGRNWPCSGGGYFRLMPLAISKWAINRINEVDQMPAVFYFHPWELDPGQPRIDGISAKTRFRHYLNLGKFEARLKDLLQAYRWERIDRVFMVGS